MENNIIYIGKKTINSMEEQLHEQYAINNNANLSSIVALVVALIAVIGCYGYVFVHSTLCFSCSFDVLYNNSTNLYTLDVLLLAYLASVVVLSVLSCLCIYQGIAQRKEQFIIYSIRKKNGFDFDLLPSYYTPFDKKGLKIVQGLYGELIKIFVFIFVILTIVTSLKLIFHLTYCCQNNSCCSGIDKIIIVGLIVLVVFMLCLGYFLYYKCKYENVQLEYKNKDKDRKEY